MNEQQGHLMPALSGLPGPRPFDSEGKRKKVKDQKKLNENIAQIAKAAGAMGRGASKKFKTLKTKALATPVGKAYSKAYADPVGRYAIDTAKYNAVPYVVGKWRERKARKQAERQKAKERKQQQQGYEIREPEDMQETWDASGAFGNPGETAAQAKARQDRADAKAADERRKQDVFTRNDQGQLGYNPERKAQAQADFAKAGRQGPLSRGRTTVPLGDKKIKLSNLVGDSRAEKMGNLYKDLRQQMSDRMANRGEKGKFSAPLERMPGPNPDANKRQLGRNDPRLQSRATNWKYKRTGQVFNQDFHRHHPGVAGGGRIKDIATRPTGGRVRNTDQIRRERGMPTPGVDYKKDVKDTNIKLYGDKNNPFDPVKRARLRDNPNVGTNVFDKKTGRESNPAVDATRERNAKIRRARLLYPNKWRRMNYDSKVPLSQQARKLGRR